MAREGVEVARGAVEQCVEEAGDAGEEHVVRARGDAVDDGLPGEAVEELEVEEQRRERRVLVEEVLDQAPQAEVRHVAVHEEQAHEEPELRDDVVGGVGCLAALLARDAHAHVRGLDHRHVVRAVADRERLALHRAARCSLTQRHGGTRSALRGQRRTCSLRRRRANQRPNGVLCLPATRRIS